MLYFSIVKISIYLEFVKMFLWDYEFQTILGSYSSHIFLFKRNLQINFRHWDIPLYKGILGSRNIEYEIYKDILE